jgi:hypothetical protein
MTEEQQQAQAHPPSWASMFDHADEPVFSDFAPVPDDRSSAAKHVRMVRSREQEARQAWDLAVIARAADAQDDDLALDRATELLRQGKPVPVALRLRATRAAQRQGGAMPSSAEQLAARYRDAS